MPKSRIYGHFEQFVAPLSHSKAQYTTKEVHLETHIFPKVSIKIVLPENVVKAIFCEVEMLLKCTKVVYMVILSCFGHSDSLKSPIYYERSTCRGSYSPKSLHKLYYQKMYSKLSFFKYKCA